MPKKTRKSGKTSNPSASAIVYTGAVRPATGSGAPNDAVTVHMSFINSMTGGTVGLQNYYGTVNCTSCADWSKYSALYDEYRVLGMQVDYWPNALDGSTQVNQSAGMSVSTHSTSNPFPFTSLSVIGDYGTVQPFYTSRPCKLVWKMASTEESQFAPTASSGSQGYVGFWAPNATSTGSGAYGYALVSFAVQFRGRT